jgi:hypothetical protein
MNGQLDLLALAVMAWEAVSGFLHSDIARWMLYFLLGQWLVRVYIRIGNARVAPLLEAKQPGRAAGRRGDLSASGRNCSTRRVGAVRLAGPAAQDDRGEPVARILQSWSRRTTAGVLGRARTWQVSQATRRRFSLSQTLTFSRLGLLDQGDLNRHNVTSRRNTGVLTIPKRHKTAERKSLVTFWKWPKAAPCLGCDVVTVQNGGSPEDRYRANASLKAVR